MRGWVQNGVDIQEIPLSSRVVFPDIITTTCIYQRHRILKFRKIHVFVWTGNREVGEGGDGGFVWVKIHSHIKCLILGISESSFKKVYPNKGQQIQSGERLKRPLCLLFCNFYEKSITVKMCVCGFLRIGQFMKNLIILELMFCWATVLGHG